MKTDVDINKLQTRVEFLESHIEYLNEYQLELLEKLAEARMIAEVLSKAVSKHVVLPWEEKK